MGDENNLLAADSTNGISRRRSSRSSISQSSLKLKKIFETNRKSRRSKSNAENELPPQPPVNLPTQQPTQSQSKSSDKDDLKALLKSEPYQPYKLWANNAHYLYDLLVTSTQWKAFTLEWSSDVYLSEMDTYSIHTMYMGTYAPQKETDYLIQARFKFPNIDLPMVKDNENNVIRPGPGMPVCCSSIKATEFVKIPHIGGVLRIRSMPPDNSLTNSLVATKSSTGEVNLFEFPKSNTIRDQLVKTRPILTLKGHIDEGYGLSWNPNQQGRLISSSDDGLVCLWDIEARPRSGRILRPLRSHSFHNGTVGQVDWSYFYPDLCASVGDRQIILWDTRSGHGDVRTIVDAHEGEVHTIAFNPHNEYRFLTGSADKTIALRDLRNALQPVKIFNFHLSDVYQVNWSPFNKKVFASCSADHVGLWNIDNIYQSAEDDLEGPAELMFIHGGHQARVLDLNWHPQVEWFLASVDEGHNLHMWMPGEHCF